MSPLSSIVVKVEAVVKQVGQGLGVMIDHQEATIERAETESIRKGIIIHQGSHLQREIVRAITILQIEARLATISVIEVILRDLSSKKEKRMFG